MKEICEHMYHSYPKNIKRKKAIDVVTGVWIANVTEQRTDSVIKEAQNISVYCLLMGNNDEVKSVKTEKSSPPLTADPKNHTNQTNIHVYPDWAAMQAYYGPRLPMPPYYNAPAASGHAPHPYMWGPPQTMMSPYGAPYAAIYSHGSVYAHPAVPLAANPSSMETPTKSSGNNDRGLVKKPKGFDALEMSIGNGNAENAEGGADQSLSKSSATEGSSSDGNTSGANQTRRKRTREGTPTTGMTIFTKSGDQKPEMQASLASAKDVNPASYKALGTTIATVGVPGKLVRPAVSPGVTNVLELKNSSNLNLTSATSVEQPSAVLPPETWLQNERELKRERRKQSNRESARRSRLRKQAETDELARKVEALNADNVSLKSEINRLTESSDRLRVENASLMEKLKKARVGRMEEIIMKIDDNRVEAISTENLLSRVNNSGALARDVEEEGSMYEKNAGAKLHQLLDASPRTDAIVAS
ncbi:common plant regulatory factor 1 isoform X4 [Rosa chinensis]|uniref:common plant regulatory factor 1 isoform X4 n=1 Tax=Rosa chinensis TaxID=74649 RepID=UPI000D097887|nr:common plant regulatory factor 1 isoform X4 [Rosa chinensis]